MALEEYRKKRDFHATPEPAGSPGSRPAGTERIYVIQKHQARNLHYDFRLEWNGVLLSWAVPKGPSLDPVVKRLATQVEDHPVEYAEFEGIIPEAEYGGGTVMIWDRGTWVPEVADVDAALERGDFKFTLVGEKLQGSWALVRTRGFPPGSGKTSWLLIKHRDAHASEGEITATKTLSVVSHRNLAEIARDGGGNVEKAAAGDAPRPAAPARRRSAGRSAGGAGAAGKAGARGAAGAAGGADSVGRAIARGRAGAPGRAGAAGKAGATRKVRSKPDSKSKDAK